jgi:hypothetical protein
MKKCLVSSLILQRNGQMTHSLEKYLFNFRLVADLGSNIIFFLDKKIDPPDWLGPNIKVIPISIDELQTFHSMHYATSLTQGKGASYNPQKNTLDYLIIQNSKLELISKALNISDADRFAWIDSGITHILKKPEKTLTKLNLITHLEEGIIIPGCWDPGNRLDDINWRFCGGFFTGDRKNLEEFYQQSRFAIRTILPLATWEVNVWAWMEITMKFPFKWYQADHNDSIFDFENYLKFPDVHY